jgi:hypothetical protein
MTIYEKEGHGTRKQYLNHLAEQYGVSRQDVAIMAELLGESEDFDGLVSMLDDFEGGF